MLTIKSILNNSIASKKKLEVGDKLISINNRCVDDIIDYKYLSSNYRLSLKVENKNGKTKNIKIEKDIDEDIGLEFEDIKFYRCNNKCIFCFYDQMPKGLRNSLYFKDDDYRLSFLSGNFITLTNINEKILNKIIKYRLSPLYISVHTTDPELRIKMLGNKRAGKILEYLMRLKIAGIDMHTQIVICPGINDGDALLSTITHLAWLWSAVRSVALVPVGITKFREGLYPLKSIDEIYAKKIIETFEPLQKKFRKRFKLGFLYIADEFYLKADPTGSTIPPARYYDDFPQIENGVGMVRRFINDFEKWYKQNEKTRKRENEENSKFSTLNPQLSYTIVTGVSFSEVMQRVVVDKLNKLGIRTNLAVIKNDFFGETVTVAGLLTGRDIISQLKDRNDLGDVILLPPDAVNEQGLLLDDVSVKDIEKELKKKVMF